MLPAAYPVPSEKRTVLHVVRRLITGFLAVILAVTAFTPAVRGAGKPQAKAYILMEAGTGRVLLAENEQTPLPIASTTKILTALLTLEQPALDTMFRVDDTAIRVEGTSMGLRSGDEVSLRTLAYGMLLSSGNDAANAAAVRIDGSLEAFAARMNRRAAELGLKNSHFVTPSGLDAPEHYCSALDLALLTRAALKNPDFSEICASGKATVSFGNPAFSRTLYNHNRLLSSYPDCIGVKTGYTKKAGRCLVSAASRDGVTLICVTLAAADDWNLHRQLLDQGFTMAIPQPLPLPRDGLTAQVVGGREETVSVQASGQAYACVETPDSVEVRLCLERFYYAPVTKGQVMGEVQYLFGGEVIARLPLTAAGDVPVKEQKKGFFQSLWERFFGSG